jgi:thiamine-phosphate diphosphorylase
VESGSLNRRPLLCLVTSGQLSAAHLDGFTAHIRAAASAGIDLIQIREPRAGDRVVADAVRAAVEAVAGTEARIVVNDRVDVAIVAGAAGVHLRGDSIAAPDARAIAPEGFLVGRSVHSAAEAIEAERLGGCDYVTFGTVFPSRSKPHGHRAAGLDALRQVCQATRLPVLAIGGVTIERVAAVAAAGAAGIAAIALFAAGDRLAATVRDARRAFDT